MIPLNSRFFCSLIGTITTLSITMAITQSTKPANFQPLAVLSANATSTASLSLSIFEPECTQSIFWLAPPSPKIVRQPLKNYTIMTSLATVLEDLNSVGMEFTRAPLLESGKPLDATPPINVLWQSNSLENFRQICSHHLHRSRHRVDGRIEIWRRIRSCGMLYCR